jgi:hypothetical protein
MENNILDFNQAMTSLEQVSNSFVVDIWIPSLNKTILFKQLDAKQQKEILSSVMDTSVYNTSFIKTFYNIIKENISDSTVDINEFTLIDKLTIGLSLKSKLSENLTLFFGEKKEIPVKINIDDILEKLKTYESPKNKIIESKNSNFSIKVELKYVTIGVEYDYDTHYKGNKKTEDLKKTEDVQKIISDAFIGETSKYLNNIWINEDILPFRDLSFDQKTRIVEKFPSNLLQKIIENIGLWKSSVDSILSIDYEDQKQTISLEPAMFLS